MKITVYVERTVTALVDQNLKYAVSEKAWHEALKEHDGDVEEAFDALNAKGAMELERAEDLVDDVLTTHEISIEVGDPDEE